MNSSNDDISPSKKDSVDSPIATKKSVDSPTATKKSSEITSILNMKSVGSSHSNLRMDVTDFIRCSEIDDVLVQALTRRARYRVINLMKKAEEIHQKQHQHRQLLQHPSQQLLSPQQQQSKQSYHKDGGGTNSDDLLSLSAEKSVLDIASDMLIKQFKNALK